MLSKSIEYGGQNIGLFPKKILQSTQFLQMIPCVLKSCGNPGRIIKILINLDTIGFLTDIYISGDMNYELVKELVEKIDYIKNLELVSWDVEFRNNRFYHMLSMDKISSVLYPKIGNIVNLCIDSRTFRSFCGRKFQCLERLTVEDFLTSGGIIDINIIQAHYLKIIHIESYYIDYGSFFDASLNQDMYPYLHSIKTGSMNTRINLSGTNNFKIVTIEPRIIGVKGEMFISDKINSFGETDPKFIHNFPNLTKIMIDEFYIDVLIENNCTMHNITEVTTDYFSNKLHKVFPNMKIFNYIILKRENISHEILNESLIEVVNIFCCKYNQVCKRSCDVLEHMTGYTFTNYTRDTLNKFLELKKLKEINIGDLQFYRRENNTIILGERYEDIILPEEKKVVIRGHDLVRNKDLQKLFELKKRNSHIKEIFFNDTLVYSETEDEIFSILEDLPEIGKNIKRVKICSEAVVINQIKYPAKLSICTSSLRLTGDWNCIESIDLEGFNSNFVYVYFTGIFGLLPKITSEFKHLFTINGNFSLLYVGDSQNLKTFEYKRGYIHRFYCREGVDIVLKDCTIDCRELCPENITSLKLINCNFNYPFVIDSERYPKLNNLGIKGRHEKLEIGECDFEVKYI